MRILIIPAVLAAAALSACASDAPDIAYARDPFPTPIESIDPAFLPGPAAPVSSAQAVSARVPDIVGATVFDAYGHPAGDITGVTYDRYGLIATITVRVADGSTRLLLPADVSRQDGQLVSGFSAEQIESLPRTIELF